jgi:hypothetical protein
MQMNFAMNKAKEDKELEANLKNEKIDTLLEGLKKALLELLLVFIPLVFSSIQFDTEKTKPEINFSQTSNESQFLYSYADKENTSKRLTAEQFRKFEGLGNLSDKQALERIDGLYKLSIITYNIFKYGA